MALPPSPSRTAHQDGPSHPERFDRLVRPASDGSEKLPTGTVTFLFTDLEGSTRLWEQHPVGMRTAVDRHLTLLRAAITAERGAVFRMTGDGLCAAFTQAPSAVLAALRGQLAMAGEAWAETGPLRARMALHTGAVDVQGGDYVGSCLNRLGRLLKAGHGGQVLLSQATADLTREALPPEVALGDLGQHRLRDLEQAEHIYQLRHPQLPADFPPLQTSASSLHNLPIQVTTFIGRERELAEVKQILGRTRLLTLIGVGGCGKTRLALQAAADLLDGYADGVWLVELESLADQELVPSAVAAALGVHEQPGRPIAAALVDALRSKRLLLLLDNCEHLLDASAALVAALIRGCPDVQVLATSREVLRLPGEVAWRVPSLALPDRDHLPPPEELARVDAVHLFVERASAARPGFALDQRDAPAVAAICCRLDGIPLALELAAACVRTLPARQLATLLDQRFQLPIVSNRSVLPRQQTLRATIDWSYDRLTEPERAFFARLAVFAGGYTLDAAEAVCSGEGIERERVLHLLVRLVDASLVVAEERPDGTGRYRLLETLRQYGREQLVATGRADVFHGQHAAYFLELAERAASEGGYGSNEGWPAPLEGEQDNLRDAVWWYASQGETERGLRLTRALGEGWSVRHTAEGRAWRAKERAGAGRATGLVPGADFGPFRIEALLSPLGPLIAVYKAYYPALQCHRAIYVLLPDLGRQQLAPDIARMFEAIAALRHPHLLATHEYGLVDGLIYVAGDFIEGGDLRALIGTLSTVTEVAALLAPLADALDYAHEQGVVHGLVEPQNVLRRRNGEPVLAFVGIARIFDTMQRQAGVSAQIGTPDYMAPEQVAGKGVVPSSDRYALAVLAYALLAGRPPFKSDLPWATLWAQVHTPVPPPRELNPALSAAVEAVLLKGLAKRPEARYPSASAFISALAASGR